MRLRKAHLENPAFIADLARDGDWHAARQCRNPDVILAALDRLKAQRDEATVFMRTVVTGPDTVAQWVAAIDALRRLQNPEIARSDKWGSAKRAARLRAVVDDPFLLEGVRAAVMASAAPETLDWFAVLATDARAESVDALLPHVTRALEGDHQTIDRLLTVLESHRAAPLLRPMREALEEARARLIAAAGVPGLASQLDVPAQKLHFQLELQADRVQASLTLDGGSALPVLGEVNVSRPRRKTVVTSLAGLGLERALAVIRRGVATLEPGAATVELTTRLRGRRSRQLTDWLEEAIGTKVRVVRSLRWRAVLDPRMVSALMKLRAQQS